MNTNNFKSDIKNSFDSFELGERNKPFEFRDKFNMHIMTCDNIIFMITQAVKNMTKKECYVNLGVYRGGSLLPPAYFNKDKKCIGVDNWCKFDNENKNEGIVKDYMKRFDIKNVEIITNDHNRFFDNYTGDKIGVFFADGGHSYDETLEALSKCEKHMAKKSIIIVDDTDRQEIENACIEFVKNSKFKELWDIHGAKYIKDRHKLKAWWDGIKVLSR